MRVISGILKGAVLHPPKNLPVRPTTDRAKESLFNILVNQVELSQLHVLDLFAGTGNISIEFCSHECASVTSVDLDFGCVQYMKTLREKYQLQHWTIVKKDAFAYLNQCDKTFDIIFADAPYAHRELPKLPSLIRAKNLIQAGGQLIIEHPSHLDFTAEFGFFDKRIYGQSTFSFFRFT